MSIHQDSVERMEALRYGDPVTNISAGILNPHRHAWFVAYEVPERKNRYGLVMRSHWARCRDAKGETWRTGIDVVHPGHLDESTSLRLFGPVWMERYGHTGPAAPHASAGDGGGA